MKLFRRSNYWLKFLVLPSKLLTLFHEIYLDFIWWFVRTKLVSRCGFTTVCNRVNKHHVLQLSLSISSLWIEVITKTRKENNKNLKKSCFTLVIYFIVKTLLILYRNDHLEISASPLSLPLYLSYKTFYEKIHQNIL